MVVYAFELYQSFWEGRRTRATPNHKLGFTKVQPVSAITFLDSTSYRLLQPLMPCILWTNCLHAPVFCTENAWPPTDASVAPTRELTRRSYNSCVSQGVSNILIRLALTIRGIINADIILANSSCTYGVSKIYFPSSWGHVSYICAKTFSHMSR